jgi:2-polyprenyl-3-methyl-5-hydroxy-6-metoxy-1,4-benzoquinol methylase
MKNKLDSHVDAYTGNNLYDYDNEILLNWYPKRVLKLTEDRKSILELGVGHGYSTNLFSKEFERHLVLDGSKAVIDNFNTNFPECSSEIIETYFEEFDTEEKFDVIVLGFILEHVDDPILILKKYKKYLSPNGKMYASVPNAEVMNRKLGYLMGVLPNMQTLSENDKLLGHQRYYSLETFEKDVVEAGYEISKKEGIYLKPFTTSQMLSLKLDEAVIDSLCELGVDYPELSCGLLFELK